LLIARSLKLDVPSTNAYESHFPSRLKSDRLLAVSFQQVVHPAPAEDAEVVETSTVLGESRMDIHKNARLIPTGRERLVNMVLSGQTPQAAAIAGGVCPRTVRKWLCRFRQGGWAGLHDRSSRPHRLRQPTPQPVIDRIEVLRRQRLPGKEIAAQVGVSPATVSRVLKRLGLHKLSALEPAEPPRRYQRERPGELIHIDIKKLGRIGSIGHRITGRKTGVINRHLGIGWEFVHVCIDDASRIAFTAIKPDACRKATALSLRSSVAYYKQLGITVERVMTDNGSCYRSKAFRKACKCLGVRQIFTKPYTPRTKAKTSFCTLCG
jgi:transposase InsO family protein